MKKFFVSMLALLLALCCVAGALGEENVRVITTRLIFDGQIYDNTTRVTWQSSKKTTYHKIEWNGDREYIYMPYFTEADLVDLPKEDDFYILSQQYVDGNISFTATDDSDFNRIKSIVEDMGFTIVGYLAPTNNYLIHSDKEIDYADLQKTISKLQNENIIISRTVVLEYIIDSVLNYYPSDPWEGDNWNENGPQGSKWGVEAIHAPTAWNYVDRMSDLNVGVIDGFIWPDHEDLDVVKVYNDPDIAQMVLERLKSYVGQSGYSHGTHVSGTFAGKFDNNKGISGVFPKGHIFGGCLDYLRDDPNIVSASCDLVKYYLLLMRENDVKVINMSYGLDIKNIDLTVGDFSFTYNSLRNDENNRKAFYSYLCYLYNDCGGMSDFFDKIERINQTEKTWDFVFVHAAGNDIINAEINGWPQCITSKFFKDRLITVGSFRKINEASLEDVGKLSRANL